MTSEVKEERPTGTYSIDPARLQRGEWCDRTEKFVGEGDIYASYSADRIANNLPVRKPFYWKSGLWVCIGLRHLEAEVYHLMPLNSFKDEPLTYEKTCAKAEEARRSPKGFYHGMALKHQGRIFVLCGPPVLLIPSESERLNGPAQMDLFGDAF